MNKKQSSNPKGGINHDEATKKMNTYKNTKGKKDNLKKGNLIEIPVIPYKNN